MEDFDVFTDEINYTKPFYCNIIKNFTKDIPLTPNGANYQNGKKLLAEECLADNDDLGCAFNLSEAVSASLRTLALYREDQLKYAQDSKLQKVKGTMKNIEDLIKKTQCFSNKKSSDTFSSLLNIVGNEKRNTTCSVEEDPFHKRYLKFSPENNRNNFRKILKELPKEWTVIQLSAPFNPQECLKPQEEYKCEINAIYLSVFTNEYLDESDLGPFNVVIPAYVPKEGERPLFNELYSLLEENYKTIENAQSLNNKRLVQNYWNRREDIDLRMKSVIMIMDREWLGGWNSLLTGKLIDPTYRERIMKLVDDTILDWGFVRLTQKQKILLYNLIESSSNLSSKQIKSGIRRILTEHGNPHDLRQSLDLKDCDTCSVEFNLPGELCLKCLSRCFQVIHKFTLVDGIKAFSDLAIQIRERDEWQDLKKAKRYPVILIVDEILDTFPWESLPILNTHPVSRMENIHYLYYLYKVHEHNFVNGYYMVGTENGRYIINPEKNLDRMEKRMSSFIKYWCPQWKGVVGKMPEPQEYTEILQDADMFLYCGHGDGLQLTQAPGPSTEPGLSPMLGVLAGCGSVRLPPAPPRAPTLATHHHYHTRHSPLVIGMLWEVTDLEVDKVVTALISLSVPSAAPLPWQKVPKENWTKGVLDVNMESASKPATPQVYEEGDLLRAVSKARRSTNFVMIASSMVARGLPLKIADKKTNENQN